MPDVGHRNGEEAHLGPIRAVKLLLTSFGLYLSLLGLCGQVGTNAGFSVYRIVCVSLEGNRRMLAESIIEERGDAAFELEANLEKFNSIYEADVEYEGLSSVFVEFCCIVVFDLKLGPTLGCVVPPILDASGKPLAGVSRKVVTAMTSKLPFLALPENGVAMAEVGDEEMQKRGRVIDMWDGGEYQSLLVLPDAIDGGDVLFGVSHFVRLLDDDAYRGAKQAAVVVLSRAPLFDVFLHQLHSFSLDILHEDNCSEQLRRLACSLKDLPSTLLEYSLVKQGLPIRRLSSAVSTLRLVGILKLVLLGGRILLFSKSTSRASSAALAVAALFPALAGEYLEPHTCNSDKFVTSQTYRWKKHGFPLKLFGKRIVFQPMLVMVMAENVFAQDGFLAGVSNEMIPALASAKLDCLVDLDTGKMVKKNTPKAKAAFEECVEDKRLSQYIASGIQLDELRDDSAWLGSNEFVSSAFEAYLETLTKSISSVMKDCKFHPPLDNTIGTTFTTSSTASTSSNTVYKQDLFPLLKMKNMLNGAAVASFSLFKTVISLPMMPWQQRSMENEGSEKTYYDRQEIQEKKVSLALSRQFGQKWITEWMKTECFSSWCSMHSLDSDYNNNTCNGTTNINSSSSHPQATVTMRNSSVINGGGDQSFPVIENGCNIQVMTYPNGDVYKGELDAKGQAHGHGIYTSMATSHCYDGYWYCGMRHGRGVLTSGSKDYIYEDDWAHNVRTGQGQAIFKGREVYSGNWLNNQYHGFGEHCTSDGSVYSGTFMEGLRHGAGSLIIQGEPGCPPREVYKGDWMYNKRHGLGQSMYADGSMYTGNWEADCWHGEGVYKSVDNEIYEGEIRNGKKHGIGTLKITTENLILNGIWQFGERSEDSNEWHIMYVNKGEEYCGHIKDGIPHGEGIFKHSDGSIYSGNFVNGVRCGQGIHILSSGEVLKGRWYNGSFSWADGTCEVILPDGSKTEI